jgi:hypothetical protein
MLPLLPLCPRDWDHNASITNTAMATTTTTTTKTATATATMTTTKVDGNVWVTGHWLVVGGDDGWWWRILSLSEY